MNSTAIPVAAAKHVRRKIKIAAPKKSPVLSRGRVFPLEDGLAVTYFRVRNCTIGANPFHGPVRDGKARFRRDLQSSVDLHTPPTKFIFASRSEFHAAVCEVQRGAFLSAGLSREEITK
jgi:hypothetical protein